MGKEEDSIKTLRDDLMRLMDSQDNKLKAIAGDHAEVMKQIIERVKALEQKNIKGDVDGIKQMVEKQDKGEQRTESTPETKAKYLFA